MHAHTNSATTSKLPSHAVKHLAAWMPARQPEPHVTSAAVNAMQPQKNMSRVNQEGMRDAT